MKRHLLISFFVLAYALSWWGWFLYAFNHGLPPVASFGPFLAALIGLGITRGRAGILGLLSRMIRWRLAPVWYVVALGLPVIITLCATMLNVFLGAPAPSAGELRTSPRRRSEKFGRHARWLDRCRELATMLTWEKEQPEV